MGGGKEREGDRNRRARTCRVQMPHVSAALRPPTGTHARAPAGARGQVVPRRGTWFWRAELGRKARRVKNPELGTELGKRVPDVARGHR